MFYYLKKASTFIELNEKRNTLKNNNFRNAIYHQVISCCIKNDKKLSIRCEMSIDTKVRKEIFRTDKVNKKYIFFGFNPK